MVKIVCPYCHSAEGQVKAGLNHGVQRYKCPTCRRRYTPEYRPRGYAETIRRQAIQLHMQGLSFQEIGRRLGVNRQSVANWVGREGAQHSAEAPTSGGAPSEAPPSLAPQFWGEAPQPGKRRPTIGDVAERAGVSTSTISNYLNDKGRMGAATRERIQAAMEELHFTPSALMRAIRRRRTRILGLLMFGLDTMADFVGISLSPHLLVGIYEGAEAAKHDVLLYTGWPQRPERNSGLDFLSGHIDGLLWVAPDLHTPALERVAMAGLPVVTLLSRHVPACVGYVNADNFTAMHLLTAHLAELGRQRIAYVGPAHNSNFIDRLEGYRQGLAAVGLPYDPELEVTRNLIWSSEEYVRAVDAWLALPSPPTAIIVPDDGWASRVCEAVRARGLRVPEDIAVTGFNDLPDTQHLAGGLTTIRQPFRQIGRIAVERLLALIEGEPVEACRVTVPVQLVVRASTVSRP